MISKLIRLSFRMAAKIVLDTLGAFSYLAIGTGALMGLISMAAFCILNRLLNLIPNPFGWVAWAIRSSWGPRDAYVVMPI